MNNKLVIIVGVVVLLAGIGIVSNTSKDDAMNSATSEGTEIKTSFTEEEVQKIKEDEPVIFGQDEVIEFTTQSMKFVSAKSSKVLVPEFGSPEEATAGSKFVVVEHTVTNKTDTPFTYLQYTLFDIDGNQYNYDFDASFSSANYIISRELPPNVPETGTVAFKVPEDTTEFRFGGANGATEKLNLVEFTVE